MQRFDELLRDCSVLFGREARVSRHFLETLEMPALKAAFRRRALHTHPDLFSDQAQWIQRHHAELFIGASEAYQRLSRYLTLRYSRPDFPAERRHSPVRRPGEGRATGERQPFFSGAAGHAGSSGSRVHVPQGVPAWPLRTGEFLYYSSVISWKVLISAIVWQRQRRERIGDIAQRWGWLSEDEIRHVAYGKYPGERLGEVLLRRSRITPFQLSMLLWHQRKSQRPIGRFFVERGLITETRLRSYLTDLEKHNWKYRPRTAACPFNK